MRRDVLRVVVLLGCVAGLLAAQESRPESAPVTAVTLNADALKLADSGEFERAIELLERARALDPHDTTLTQNLAVVITRRAQRTLERGETAEALVDLVRALNLAPKRADVRTQYTAALHADGDLFRARTEVERALTDDPAYAPGFEELGRIAYHDDELEESLLALDTALKLDPKPRASLREFRAKVANEWNVEKAFFRSERGAFIVKFDDQTFKQIGDQVLDFLDAAEMKIRQSLGHVPRRRVSVVLYTRGDFSTVTGAHEWTGGLFDGKIRVPVRNFDVAREQIKQTLAHEYTHVVVRDITARCPTWLNEGLAQVIEGRNPGSVRAYLRCTHDL